MKCSKARFWLWQNWLPWIYWGKWEGRSSLTGSLVLWILYSSYYNAVCPNPNTAQWMIYSFFIPASDINGCHGFAGVTAKEAGNWLRSPPGWNVVCCVSKTAHVALARNIHFVLYLNISLVLAILYLELSVFFMLFWESSLSLISFQGLFVQVDY